MWEIQPEHWRQRSGNCQWIYLGKKNEAGTLDALPSRKPAEDPHYMVYLIEIDISK